jgi:hypothetical protein
VERQIGLAEYTIAMLLGAVAQLEQKGRDTRAARHYLRDTRTFIDELRAEREMLRADAPMVEQDEEIGYGPIRVPPISPGYGG